MSLNKQEREAEEFAAHILMPEAELARLKGTPPWELADHFGVPEDIVRQRMTVFATQEEKASWQSVREDH